MAIWQSYDCINEVSGRYILDLGACNINAKDQGYIIHVKYSILDIEKCI